MQTLVVLAVLLLALIVLKPLVRVVIAAFAGPSIGEKALSRIPDTLNLEPATGEPWKDPNAARRLASELVKRGFEDGGIYTAGAMPGVTLQLMVQPVEGILGIVYEHPVAGQWVELTTRYQDGTSYHVTSSRDTGLNQRPGHRSVHLPGATPDMLHKRLISGRPQGEAEALDARGIASRFEALYAESVAWRKSQGISRTEVVKVATRKIA